MPDEIVGTQPPLDPRTLPQQRRTDPLNDRDVKAKVDNNEEFTSFEKFMRRTAAQKMPIGRFLIGLGTFLTSAAMFFPEKWLIGTAALSGVAGGLLVGAGSTTKSDQYDAIKNALLKQRGLM